MPEETALQSCCFCHAGRMSRQHERALHWCCLAVLASGLLSGCVVSQPRGCGQVSHMSEPTTGRGYWLYLPKGCPANGELSESGRRWPLVMTFHGMHPWDSANPQCREWQKEADRYGFIVCAPELATCNSFMEYPIRKIHASIKADEQAIVAIMDDVCRRTNADPNRVLSTSWSAGGYIAHYIVNRHPERFSCLAVRQSNFSSKIMNPACANLYSDMPVAVFYTENDFQACRRESEAAVEWYRQHGFENVQGAIVGGMGHERTPEVAAAVFAKACAVPPKTIPTRLRRIRVLALMEPAPPSLPRTEEAISIRYSADEKAERHTGKL